MTLNTAGLDELYAGYSAYLYRFMLNLTRDREDAADLVQEIFLRLCQQEELPVKPKTWLSQTGYRLFVDQWRRRRRYARLPLEADETNRFTPEQAAIDREFERQLHGHLGRLHPLARQALTMRIYGQCSYGEISRALGCPENTVKSSVRRGRAQLARWL